MVPIIILKNKFDKKRKTFLHSKIFVIVFSFILFVLIFCVSLYLTTKHIFNDIFLYKDSKIKNKEDMKLYSFMNKNKNYLENCYLPADNYNLNIIHVIITRFMIDFWQVNNFSKIIYTEDYIKNGIRVMQTYLFPSLENQNCKKFIWVLLLGEKANISYIESLINLNNSFQYKIIYNNLLKNYLKNLTKDSEVLITTRIDYDDRIYYDAVNDVRKAININKPMILFGYNRGVYFFESNKKYYEFYSSYNNEGVMSIFCSLIMVIKKVNDIYNINDMGPHNSIKTFFIKNYKYFGIEQLNYDPLITDSGTPKFVWVRQNFSGQYIDSLLIKKKLNPYNFNLTKFNGK